MNASSTAVIGLGYVGLPLAKVTSGSTPQVAAWVDGFYGSIIAAGTHAAPSLEGAGPYRAVLAAAAHRQFLELSTEQWMQLLEPRLPQSAVLLDLKGMVPRELAALRL